MLAELVRGAAVGTPREIVIEAERGTCMRAAPKFRRSASVLTADRESH